MKLLPKERLLISLVLLYILGIGFGFEAHAQEDTSAPKPYEPTSYPTYEPKDRFGNPFYYPDRETPLMLGLPSNYERVITVDDSLKNYYIEEKMGDIQYRPASTMTYDEYVKYQTKEHIKNYWNQIADGGEDDALNSNSLIPRIYISPALDRIFGGNYVDIRPNGNITLTFGGRWQRNFNPSLTKRQQRYGGFEFDQNIGLNLVGKVGEKLKMNINWNTGATFEFENVVKIDYTGLDHEILQDVDAGNVNFPLKGSLIQGSQNIFGFKTVMKFGKLDVTSILGQQRGKSEVQEFKNGASTREIEIEAADYEMNKHFFLAQFFRDNYEKSLSQLPRIISNINITRLEVYVRNRVQRTQSLRNFAAFADLGDATSPTVPPNNKSTKSNLYGLLIQNSRTRSADDVNSELEGSFGLTKSEDFETIRQARKLEAGVDYDYHPQLGYISLRTALQNDDVLAVAFEYTYNGRNYKVGELSEDYQNLQEDDNIYLKLLRPATVNPQLPMWDLMMKNVYSLKSSRINKENFRLSVIYKNDRTGLDNPALQEGPFRDIPLLRVMNLDNLNMNGDKQPDGNFDFVDNSSGNNFSPVTIDVKNGRIYFPVLEPFGENLERRFVPTAQWASLINKYVFNEMYDGTKSDALQLATKNKYFVKVAYQSATSKDLQLNGFDIQKGSVVVTVGSTTLTEGVDYEVNYLSGKVKITNEGILNSGNTIKVRYEKQDLIASQPKTFFGSRLDYKVSDNFVLGGTILRLTERPWWRTVRQGNEPSNSTIWGLDGSYSTESRFLTKMVDKLPFIQTKAPSSVAVSGEFAQLRPGASKLIEIDGEATSYLDDFEGSETPYFLGGNYSTNKKWKLASTPQMFDEAGSSDLDYGYGRAKLAWYSVDQVFFFNNAGTLPDHIKKDEKLQANSYNRYVDQQEVFPNKFRQSVFNQLITFDLAYYPNERGPYNYDVNNLNPDGTFSNPRERWAGITKAVDYDTDFDNANIEYIEFWLMDPFADTILDGRFNRPNTTGGKLYLNLGNISEDVMKDSRFFFENGLPISQELAPDTTKWGYVPASQYLTDGFDNSEGSRAKQDLGYDGMSDEKEQVFFSDFLSALPATLNDSAKAKLQNDPSTDDFKYFLNEDYDDAEVPIVGRYKEFNGFEGNSPEGTNVFGYSTLPDKEDLNNDNTISDLEAYYQYEIDLNPNNMMVGNNYIVDEVTAVPGGNDQFIPIKWYQFRIPIRDVLPENTVGNITNFKSIRFLRMFMTDWQEPVVLRMGNFQYVSSQWRVYNDDLKGPFVGTPNHDENTLFTLSTVNIEENGDSSGSTIPYVLPSDQIRTQAYGNPQFTNALNNEQSLKLCADNLQVDDGRAVFKNVSQDLINYKKIRLYVHGEMYPESTLPLEDGDVSVFVRFGTDFTQNYYEVEVPIKITQPGATSRGEIWPIDNEINLDFEKLVGLKSERDPSFLELGRIFSREEENQFISVRGRPDLSDVRVIMLGIKNRPEGYDDNGNPVGDPKSICVWLDELRMTGFDLTSGWAAIGSVKTKLADLATVNVSGKHEHYGFGSLGQNFNARTRENTSSYDVSSTILLDKFLPKKASINLPMFVSMDRTIIAPEFDPLNPDVRLTQTIKNIENNYPDRPDSATQYKRDVLDITSNKSINFSNIKKQPSKDKKFSTPLDISNWSFSYAYSESNRTNINTATNLYKNRRGAVNYAFDNKMKPISPLKKVKFLKSKKFALIKDFNLQPLPSNVSFSADLNRSYRETLYRTINNTGALTTNGFSPLYEKNISFQRQYSMKWPITKSISLDYRANAMAKVDEREGRIDRDDEDYQEKMDVILNNLSDMGRMTDFNQNVSLSYRVPINKFPLTDWVTTDLKYNAGYNWMAGPVWFDTNGVAQMDSLGNNINNNNTQSINGRLNMVKLYNKVKFLKEINNPGRSRSRRTARSRAAKKDEEDEDDKDGKDGKDKKKDKKESNFNPVKFTLRTAMMVRNVNFSYSRTQGTTLPGYEGSPKFFGLDEDFINPGIPFVFGWQDDSIQYDLAKRGLISESNLQTQPLIRTDGYNLNLKATVEPFKDFKIQLSAQQQSNTSYQTIFKDTVGWTGDFSALSPMLSGSYSTSFIGIKTFFQKVDTGTYNNKAYSNMIDMRGQIKRTLDSYNDNSIGVGEYGVNSQDVLIPAFIKAYSGDSTDVDPRSGYKNIFKSLPLPNWNINYRGLSKVGWFKKHFSSFNIRHSYTSTYRVSNYQSSLEYGTSFGNAINPVNYYRTDITNENREYISYYVVNQAMIQERMSPLIGVDARFKKSKMNVKLSYDKSRDLSLMISNAQITEVRSDKINFTMGWVKKNLTFQGKSIIATMFNKGRPVIFKNDMDFKINLSLSDNVTIQRDMDGSSIATGGMYSFQFKPTIDYEYSKKINVQLYFGRTVNSPKVSTSFKNTVTEGGAKIRIAL